MTSVSNGEPVPSILESPVRRLKVSVVRRGSRSGNNNAATSKLNRSFCDSRIADANNFNWAGGNTNGTVLQINHDAFSMSADVRPDAWDPAGLSGNVNSTLRGEITCQNQMFTPSPEDVTAASNDYDEVFRSVLRGEQVTSCTSASSSSEAEASNEDHIFSEARYQSDRLHSVYRREHHLSGCSQYDGTSPNSDGPVKDILDSTDGIGFIDTKDLCARVLYELKRHAIPQSIFAERVLRRSQGTLSDLLRNPKPWDKLKSGRDTFRRMQNWLDQPLEQRIAYLQLYSSTPDHPAKSKRNHCSCPTPVEPHGIQDVFQFEHERAQPASYTRSTHRRHSIPSKRPRLIFTEIQKKTLTACFQQTQRPSKDMQVTIANHLGLELNTVQNFFMNARRRYRDFPESFRSLTQPVQLPTTHSTTQEVPPCPPLRSYLPDTHWSPPDDLPMSDLLRSSAHALPLLRPAFEPQNGHKSGGRTLFNGDIDAHGTRRCGLSPNSALERISEQQQPTERSNDDSHPDSQTTTVPYPSASSFNKDRANSNELYQSNELALRRCALAALGFDDAWIAAMPSLQPGSTAGEQVSPCRRQRKWNSVDEESRADHSESIGGASSLHLETASVSASGVRPQGENGMAEDDDVFATGARSHSPFLTQDSHDTTDCTQIRRSRDPAATTRENLSNETGQMHNQPPAWPRTTGSGRSDPTLPLVEPQPALISQLSSDKTPTGASSHNNILSTLQGLPECPNLHIGNNHPSLHISDHYSIALAALPELSQRLHGNGSHRKRKAPTKYIDPNLHNKDSNTQPTDVETSLQGSLSNNSSPAENDQYNNQINVGNSLKSVPNDGNTVGNNANNVSSSVGYDMGAVGNSADGVRKDAVTVGNDVNMDVNTLGYDVSAVGNDDNIVGNEVNTVGTTTNRVSNDITSVGINVDSVGNNTDPHGSNDVTSPGYDISSVGNNTDSHGPSAHKQLEDSLAVVDYMLREQMAYANANEFGLSMTDTESVFDSSLFGR